MIAAAADYDDDVPEDIDGCGSDLMKTAVSSPA